MFSFVLPSYLKSSSFQQADLVVFGEVTEAWDSLSELDHLPHGWSEAHGEFLPDLLTWLVGVHVWRSIHWTNLEKHEDTRSIKEDDEIFCSI